jgi:hypothetical protein
MNKLILLLFFTLPLLFACHGSKARKHEKDAAQTQTSQKVVKEEVSCHSSIPSRFAKIDTPKTVLPGKQPTRVVKLVEQ